MAAFALTTEGKSTYQEYALKISGAITLYKIRCVGMIRRESCPARSEFPVPMHPEGFGLKVTETLLINAPYRICQQGPTN
jgi:hypothetical protein